MTLLDAMNIQADERPSDERLGRYELLHEIGRGAMGVVYLARDPLIARQVALKVFRLGFSASDDELRNLYARFIREAQSAGILSHPHIVTVHDVAPANGDSPAFIAMEYVAGSTLKEILDAPEAIPWRRAIAFVRQVTDALDYAHSMGVVHRDIKPGNILVDACDRVKITDFGIALVNAGNITNHGQLLGTPNYMAPEAIEDSRVDHRADLFSLGVVLYELLIRHKPFDASTSTKVTYRIVHEPFRSPREHGVELPPALEGCLVRALEKDPARRFQSASHFGDALGAALRDVEDRRGAMPPRSIVEASPDRATPQPRPDVDTRSIPVRPASHASSVSRGRTRWSARVGRPTRLQIWLLAVGMTLGLGVGFLLSRERLEPEPVRVRALVPLSGRLRDLEALAAAFRAVGDDEGAHLMLSEAARIEPDAESIRTALSEAERRLRTRRERWRAEVAAALSAARLSMEDGRYRDAIEHAQVVMALDPLSLEGADILARSRELQEREPGPKAPDLELAGVSGAGVSGEGQPPAPATVEEAEGAAEEPAPVPVVSPSEPGTLIIRLTAARSPGVLTLYEGDEQIYRERFRFVKDKKGLIGSLIAKAIGGSLEREISHQPSELDLRLYVSMPGSPTQVLPVAGRLEPGGREVLRIDIDDSGTVEAELE